MNDPGLDAPIADAEQQTSSLQDAIKEEEEEEELLLEPSRWWFASTASPLIAGTVGPMASAFNIIAIAQYWRENLLPGMGEDDSPPIPDPGWLLAVNGLSLVFAVIGNASLCLNMVGRLRFAWAQPITIVGFFLASVLLIILVGIAGKRDFLPEPNANYALTQAFYYACWAAGLYLIIAVLMGITVWGALAGKYPKHFELNGSQRTLMLQTMALMVYLIGGAAVYTRLEGWSYPDAVFFADITLLTIGFGTPLVPVTHAGRSLLIPYLFGGLIAIGLVIGSIRSMLLSKGAIKMHARSTERKRQRVVELKDAEKGKTRWNMLRQSKRPSQRADTHYKSERERRRQEFLAMRKIQSNAASKQKWVALGVSSTVAAAMWFFGALVFFYAEYAQGWTYFESLYFSFVSLTTLGYGDLEPYSNSGKSFFVLWSLLAIPTLTVLVSDLGDTVVKLAADLTALLGSLSVAPTEKEFWRRLRRNVDIIFGSRRHTKKSSGKKLNKKDLAVIHQKNEYDKSRLGKWPDLLFARLTETERNDIDKYSHICQDNDHERDTLFYHFLLVKEIRSVLRDSQLDKTKTYTYDEWAYFLKLLGHDENDDTYHAKRYNDPIKDDEDGPAVGRIVDHQGDPREWSWLGLRSPLLSLKSEPEWILDRLLKKLQGEMHFQRRSGDGHLEQTKPSFDMMRFTRRQSGQHDLGSSDTAAELSQGEEEEIENEEETKHGRGRNKAADPPAADPASHGEDEAEEESQGEKALEEEDDRHRERRGEMQEAEDEALRTP